MSLSVKNISIYLWSQIYAAGCLNLSELINGFVIGWPASMLPKFDDPNQSPFSYELTEIEKSWIVSAALYGCIGAFPSVYLVNRIGRKKSLFIGAIGHLVANSLVTFATNLAMLYVGRIATGAVGCYMIVIGFTYIGEIASPNIRGILFASMGVSDASGKLLAYSVTPYVSYVTVGYINFALILLLLIFCCFLPESPMFYILKDDEDSARNILQYLGRSSEITSELKSIMAKTREQRNNKHVWKELFTSKCNRKSLFIAVSLSVFQQSSGITAVLLYSSIIFKYAGSSIQPDIGTIVIGAMFVIGAIVSPICIDKFGRKNLLALSCAGLCVSMAGLGVYFYLRQSQPSTVEKVGWLPLALLVFAQLAYSLGLSIIPTIISGELFTSRVRGLGSHLSTSSAMISALIFVAIFSYSVMYIGIHVTFWIFAICNAVAFLFVIFFVPETMKKSLMEIQEMMEK